MSQEAAIVRAIFETFDAHNELHPDNILKKDRGTRLFGDGGALDSLALVSFLMDLEEALERHLGRRFTLTDERALSAARSPFRSVESLIDFVESASAERIENGGSHE